jgi:ATP:corrinoid adenosyltransferase
MAIPKIKATYSLDADTVGLLERVSQRWRVSKSEALRRAIHAAAALPEASDLRLVLLDQLQDAVAMNLADADEWARSVRAERRAQPR